MSKGDEVPNSQRYEQQLEYTQNQDTSQIIGEQPNSTLEQPQTHIQRSSNLKKIIINILVTAVIILSTHLLYKIIQTDKAFTGEIANQLQNEKISNQVPLKNQLVKQTNHEKQIIIIQNQQSNQQNQSNKKQINVQKSIEVQQSVNQNRSKEQIQGERFNEAIIRFNPWDLSSQTKMTLLKKYKQMPLKDAKSEFMPIVQDFDKQVKPIIEQLQKNSEIIDFESIQMNAQQRRLYGEEFQRKLQTRLAQKRKDAKLQSSFLQNPDQMIEQLSKIKRRQWSQFFQYRTLVGADLGTDQQARGIAEQQRKVFEQKYETGKYQKQLFMCVVIPTHNNQKNDRYLWNIESVLQQNYTNFRVAVIDDASDDKTTELLAKHLKWRKIAKDKVFLVKWKKGLRPTAGIFYGSHKVCKMGQIQYVVDGDAQMVGRQVFRVMNAYYQKEKPLTVYSNNVVASNTESGPQFTLGASKDYPPIDIETNNFRKTVNHGHFQMRTMMADTILLTKPESLRDWKGEFYKQKSENAVYYPAMEMSCRRVKYVPQLFYIQQLSAVAEDVRFGDRYGQQVHAYNHINNQKQYSCLALNFMEISKTS